MSEPLDSPLTPERIVAFVDNELPDPERGAMAAAIAADQAAQATATRRRNGTLSRWAGRPPGYDRVSGTDQRNRRD